MFSPSPSNLEGARRVSSDDEPPGPRLRSRRATALGGAHPAVPVAATAGPAAGGATAGGMSLAFADAQLERAFAEHYAASMWRFDAAAILLLFLCAWGRGEGGACPRPLQAWQHACPCAAACMTSAARGLAPPRSRTCLATHPCWLPPTHPPCHVPAASTASCCLLRGRWATCGGSCREAPSCAASLTCTGFPYCSSRACAAGALPPALPRRRRPHPRCASRPGSPQPIGLPDSAQGKYLPNSAGICGIATAACWAS